jgi:hypothetical protein
MAYWTAWAGSGFRVDWRIRFLLWFLLIESLTHSWYNSFVTIGSLLADSEVEVRDKEYGTVYASVACPGERRVWYTFGGYPAASSGAWQQLKWPW